MSNDTLVPPLDTFPSVTESSTATPYKKPSERWEVHWQGRPQEDSFEVAGVRHHTTQEDAQGHFEALVKQFPLFDLKIVWVLDNETHVVTMEYHGSAVDEATQGWDAVDRMLAFTTPFMVPWGSKQVAEPDAA